jgi:hypothetical protein
VLSFCAAPTFDEIWIKIL